MSYTDYLKSHPIKLKPAPASFEGPFSTFYTEYVEPNLPSQKRVQQFDSLLTGYCAIPESAVIIRKVEKLTRGEMYSTDRGDSFLPSDNAPGWWLHALLVSDAALPPDLTGLFHEMPTHMFGVSKLKTLNGAGFHLAHIDDVNNGDTKWQQWDRTELVRRFLLNIHPSNWFLLSKSDFAKWGRDKAIISWVKNKYRRRYGNLLGSISDGQQLQEVTMAKQHGKDPHYFYGQHAVARAAIPRLPISSVTEAGVETKVLKRPHVCKKWMGIILDMRVGSSRYVLGHDELLAWVRDNTNALNTDSWLLHGDFHWPHPSVKMLNFLKPYERKP